ncbi:reverse transcriptase [Lasius niger]|uniref:Reverse transcriptase n=1 Tax=Lasius niger TaxID=67767 RepID=A0A0J7KG77_LASNI|nr:reverse transcriptase [Lasius niger]
MVEIVAYAKERLDLLLTCDVNSHHLVWSSTNINPKEESLFNFVMSAELHILNRGTEPTFLDFRKQEILNITLCTGGVVDLVEGWRVSSELSGSDHRQVRFALEQIQKEEKLGRNPRKTN